MRRISWLQTTVVPSCIAVPHLGGAGLLNERPGHPLNAEFRKPTVWHVDGPLKRFGSACAVDENDRRDFQPAGG